MVTVRRCGFGSLFGEDFLDRFFRPLARAAAEHLARCACSQASRFFEGPQAAEPLADRSLHILGVGPTQECHDALTCVTQTWITHTYECDQDTLLCSRRFF